MDNTEKTLKYLVELEKLAEDVLVDKQTIVQLDRTKNGIREGLRYLQGIEAQRNGGDNNCWISITSNLVKFKVSVAVKTLENEQITLQFQIDKLRRELIHKVNRLRDLEYKSPLKGFGLKPLSRQETKALRGNLF